VSNAPWRYANWALYLALTLAKAGNSAAANSQPCLKIGRGRGFEILQRGIIYAKV
jgi:hypothetical protein